MVVDDQMEEGEIGILVDIGGQMAFLVADLPVCCCRRMVVELSRHWRNNGNLDVGECHEVRRYGQSSNAVLAE